MKRIIQLIIFIILAINLPASDCVKKGTIIGDNHSISIYKCSDTFKVIASNDATSRQFSGLELKLIRKIFKTANSKYSTFKNKQILYMNDELEITTRLYSSSEWFLIFKFGDSNQKANVWIPHNKLNTFATLLN